MDLQGENRILVKEGLRRLKNTKNQGLQELIRANSLEDAKITAYHIDLCWDHVSMPVADWIQLPVLLHFSMQKQRKKQQGLLEILQLLIRAEKLSLRKEKKRQSGS